MLPDRQTPADTAYAEPPPQKNASELPCQGRLSLLANNVPSKRGLVVSFCVLVSFLVLANILAFVFVVKCK